jgi:hypothetical protein
MYGLVKYVEIERELLQDFQAAHVSGRISRMKTCADALAQFKAYKACVRGFIEYSQRGAFQSGELFEEIYKLTGQVGQNDQFVLNQSVN